LDDLLEVDLLEADLMELEMEESEDADDLDLREGEVGMWWVSLTMWVSEMTVEGACSLALCTELDLRLWVGRWWTEAEWEE